MKRIMQPVSIFAGLLVMALSAGAANAQATRTWVSGVGDDANPCSRTAPCKTFAGAISKTATNGEIDCLDPGGFGAVTITKAITIDCGGVTGGVLASGNGVIINATANTATTHVILRNLAITGFGGATGDGLRVLAARFVTLDNVQIYGFPNNDAIDVVTTAPNAMGLTIKDSFISQVSTGLKVSGTGGTAVNVDNTTFVNSPRGIELGTNLAIITVDNSTFQQLIVTAIGSATGGSGVINVSNSIVNNNGTAFNAGVAGTTIRLSNNHILNNTTGFNIAAGATIATAGNNTIQGNGGATVPNATFTEQ